MEARALAKLSSKAIAKFVYEDVIYRHRCFIYLLIDGGPENKSWLSVLTTKYKIKRTVISVYNSKGRLLAENPTTTISNRASSIWPLMTTTPGEQ